MKLILRAQVPDERRLDVIAGKVFLHAGWRPEFEAGGRDGMSEQRSRHRGVQFVGRLRGIRSPATPCVLCTWMRTPTGRT
jgi:hypothetical protein